MKLKDILNEITHTDLSYATKVFIEFISIHGDDVDRNKLSKLVDDISLHLQISKNKKKEVYQELEASYDDIYEEYIRTKNKKEIYNFLKSL